MALEISAHIHRQKVNSQNASTAMASGKRNLGPAGLVLTTRHDSVTATLKAGTDNVSRAKEATTYAKKQLSTILSQLNHVKSAATQSQGINDLQTLARLNDSAHKSIETIERIAHNTEFSGQKLLEHGAAVGAAPKNFNINTGSGTLTLALNNVGETINTELRTRGSVAGAGYVIDLYNGGAGISAPDMAHIDTAITDVQNALSNVDVQETALVDTTQSLKDAIDAERNAQKSLEEVDYTEETTKQIEAHTAASAAINALISGLKQKKEHADRAINAMG